MRFAKSRPILKNFEALVLRLLEEEHLWTPQKTVGINFLDEQFKKYTQVSQDAFDELASLVEADPQLIIDHFREAVTTETFTTFATLARPGEKKLRAEIDCLLGTFVSIRFSCLSSLLQTHPFAELRRTQSDP